MGKRVFDKKFLTNELFLPYEALEDKIIDNSRWSISHKIIFEHEGKFYSTYYSVGATEMQDESPWEYDKEVECWEVEKAKVIKEEWVSVKKASKNILSDFTDVELLRELESRNVRSNKIGWLGDDSE